jgi:hypothetical protein
MYPVPTRGTAPSLLRLAAARSLEATAEPDSESVSASESALESESESASESVSEWESGRRNRSPE